MIFQPNIQFFNNNKNKNFKRKIKNNKNFA